MKIKFERVVTTENAYDVIDSLTKLQDEIYEMVQHLAYCSRCEGSFDRNDKGSQWTEDGVLCPECHETYSIKHYPEGGVGVIENKTGRELNINEIRWL